MAKASASVRTTVARSGIQTAVSAAVVAAASAAVGVVIAREFGRDAATDGLFAAYGIYVVLVLAATAFRVVVLPGLARARGEGRLAGEAMAHGVALLALALPALGVALLAPGWVAGLLTGSLPAEAQETAADAIVWMVPAAVAHLYAGLAASALAALDDYASAAAGFAAGAASGLALILLRLDDGIVVVAWGMALNGAVALAVPAAALLARGRPRGLRATPLRPGRRLLAFAVGVALPLALQALYLVCLRFAADLGVGEVTSLSYAYLLASVLVAVTASSLALVSSVPLTRHGLAGDGAARHVAATSWLALAAVAAAAGVFALAGDAIVTAVLGEAYSEAEVGRLVVWLTPWMVASVGVSVTFPLLFVAGRERLLPALAAAALALHVPLVWAGRGLLDLGGIAGALALSTALILAALLGLLSPATLARAARGLGAAAVVTGGLAAAAFAPAALLDSPAAAALGAVLYAAFVAAIRPPGLRDAWAYVRALS